MTLRPSMRLVLPSVPALAVCDIQVREIAGQDIRINVMSCCVQEIYPCIAQGAAKAFTFTDSPTVDYGGATEITFDVWTRRPEQGGGANVLSYSLTGGDIVLPTDNQFRFTISNADSLALPAGRLYCEAWVTLSGGDRRLVGAGTFRVIDTMRHDA